MAVNGFALGGGCELAMAGDIRIAAEHAKFGQPEVNLGLIPGYGGTQRLTRLAGKGMSMHLCLTGEMINAQEALRIGLVTRVVPGAQLLDEAKRIASVIASKAPLAIAACKRAINNGAHLSLDDALEIEALEFGMLVNTEDIREGTGAFLEKRKPVGRDVRASVNALRHRQRDRGIEALPFRAQKPRAIDDDDRRKTADAEERSRVAHRSSATSFKR